MVKEENHEAMLTEKVFEAARAKCASPVATPARANTLKYGYPVGQELPTVAAHSALAQGSKACSFISEMVFFWRRRFATEVFASQFGHGSMHA